MRPLHALTACGQPPRGVDSLLKSLTRMPATPEPSQVLSSLSGLVGQEVQLDELLQALMDRVAASMQADRCTLYLIDPAKKELFSRAAIRLELKQIRLKLGQGIAGHVAANDTVVNVPAAQAAGLFNPDIDRLTGYTTLSVLAVPLKDAGGEIFGVLQVLNKLGGGIFEPEDERRLKELAAQIGQALEATSLYTELQRARVQPAHAVGYFFNRVIGESEAMRAAYKVVQKAAQTDATVLLRGESGTGKELFARAIHVNSRRREKPFVKVDCAALPGTLIENELFGHEKGAFTGAEARSSGKFEAGDGGTVFLDEIGELPLPAQGKLLRVLQDREFDRVGGTQPIKVDVRIVAATHRDLTQMVRDGKFREDLYYRIKVVELVLPPLRERGPEDLERLVRHFIAHAARRHHLSPEPKLSAQALDRLKAWHWPGNVRELENCVESAVVLCEGEILNEHLPLPDRQRTQAELATVLATLKPTDTLPMTLDQMERSHVLSVLDKSKGNRTQAAKWLGIGRNTLARKLKAYGLAGPDDE